MLAFNVEGDRVEDCLTDFETYLICRGYYYIGCSSKGYRAYKNNHDSIIRVHDSGIIRAEVDENAGLQVVFKFNKESLFGRIVYDDMFENTMDLERSVKEFNERV